MFYLVFLSVLTFSTLTNYLPIVMTGNREDFEQHLDSLILQEISYLSLNSSHVFDKDTISKYLIEIPVKQCTDTFAYFEEGNIISSKYFVGIYAEIFEQNRTKIKEIQFTHFKYVLNLPDSVFSDLHDPIFCNEQKSDLELIGNPCKVYRSSDNRRVYICLIFGNNHLSEVIWIIKNSAYYGRVINSI